MIVAHQSNTVGNLFPLLEPFDVLVHSGDMLPGGWSASSEQARAIQTEALERLAPAIAEALDNKPFVFVPGNLDYVDPCPVLRRHGVNAHNVDGIVRFVDSVIFAGVSGVPGRNYDRSPCMLHGLVEEDGLRRALTYALDRHPDVIVTHGPPRGVFDSDYGSTGFAEAWLAHAWTPTLWLFGHVDSCGGSVGDLWRPNDPVTDVRQGMTIVANSAGVTQYLRI